MHPKTAEVIVHFFPGCISVEQILTVRAETAIIIIVADVAELADAQVSGTCGLSPWRFDSSHPHFMAGSIDLGDST